MTKVMHKEDARGPGSIGMDRRDPDFIRAHLDKIALFFEHYHEVEVSGLTEVPSGRALLVGNHNGGVVSPDMFALMLASWRTFGVDSPAYGLAHDVVFQVPIFGDLLARCGAVPASPANARTLLEREAKVLVYPGGDLDAFRPWSKRHQIVFGARRGFIRVALAARAPIVPIVSVGAHEGCYVMSDGRALARALGLDKLRIEAIPIALGLPWGLFVGPWPYWPIPLRIKIRALPPIRWPELPKEAAEDDAIVDRCREEVVSAMQRGLDELSASGDFGPRLPWSRRGTQ